MKLNDDLREQIYVYHLDAFSRLGYMHKKVYMCVYMCVYDQQYVMHTLATMTILSNPALLCL
jgi:hypothetical protein